MPFQCDISISRRVIDIQKVQKCSAHLISHDVTKSPKIRIIFWKHFLVRPITFHSPPNIKNSKAVVLAQSLWKRFFSPPSFFLFIINYYLFVSVTNISLIFFLILCFICTHDNQVFLINWLTFREINNVTNDLITSCVWKISWCAISLHGIGDHGSPEFPVFR